MPSYHHCLSSLTSFWWWPNTSGSGTSFHFWRLHYCWFVASQRRSHHYHDFLIHGLVDNVLTSKSTTSGNWCNLNSHWDESRTTSPSRPTFKLSTFALPLLDRLLSSEMITHGSDVVPVSEDKLRAWTIKSSFRKAKDIKSGRYGFTFTFPSSTSPCRNHLYHHFRTIRIVCDRVS